MARAQAADFRARLVSQVLTCSINPYACKGPDNDRIVKRRQLGDKLNEVRGTSYDYSPQITGWCNGSRVLRPAMARDLGYAGARCNLRNWNAANLLYVAGYLPDFVVLRAGSVIRDPPT